VRERFLRRDVCVLGDHPLRLSIVTRLSKAWYGRDLDRRDEPPSSRGAAVVAFACTSLWTLVTQQGRRRCAVRQIETMSDAVVGEQDRHVRAARTFVQIVDSLVDKFDVVDLLTQLASSATNLLDVSAAGILLVDERGELCVIAASSEQVRLLELFQIQNEQGPCLDAYRTGAVVADHDLGPHSQWPEFAQDCVAAGYPSVCAIPLRLRELTIGCLNLFVTQRRPLLDGDVALARALADVATITIVQDQAMRAAAAREIRLRHALTSRIVIEQAKGMIAERAHLDMEQSFKRLREHARTNNLGLTAVAAAIVTGKLPIAQLNEGRRT
jgi:transcriptional regulator with GAF, ATPase, and Fis domain